MHVVDCDTRFHNAPFITDTSTRALWSLFTEIGPTVYSGCLDIFKVDGETLLMSKNFVKAAEEHGLVVQAL